MTPRPPIQDDPSAAAEQEAHQGLVEFANWRHLRPAWLLAGGSNLTEAAQPPATTLEYFGKMVCVKFPKTLHQGFSKKASAEEEADVVIKRKRAQQQRNLERVPMPESWMDAWPDFWNYLTRQRPEGPARIHPLFKVWPMMDEEEVGQRLQAWEAGGCAGSVKCLEVLSAMGLDVPKTVCSMKARLNLPMKELVREWCDRLGMLSEIEDSPGLTSTEEKVSGVTDADGPTVGDGLTDARVTDSAAEAGIDDLRRLAVVLPREFFADLTMKERAVACLSLFRVPLYKAEVTGCEHLDPPRDKSSLYELYKDITRRLEQKARQLVSDPVLSTKRTALSPEADEGTVQAVAAILDEEVRRVLLAWAGHPGGNGTKILEKAPEWLLKLLSTLKPHWQTL